MVGSKKELYFAIGQPLSIKLITTEQSKVSLTVRILAISAHTLTISIPYDAGKMILWPVGTRIEVICQQEGQSFDFATEIIGRDLGELKAYTIMRPHAISRVNQRTLEEGACRVIAVTSGKGGVGKTTFTINLAIAMAAEGKRVFIIDTDLGTANVDILLRLQPQYNLTHLLSGQKSLIEIAIQGPGNIGIIPGGSGLPELTQMSENQFTKIITSFNQLDGLADVILLDTGAGISRDVSNFLLAADEVIVITTPEPHAIMDAYAIIKVMHSLKCQASQFLVINRSDSEQEAQGVCHKLVTVVRNFLQKEMTYLGYITDDKLVSRSLKEQNPLLLAYPNSTPAKNIREVANKLLHKPPSTASGLAGFVNKLLIGFNKKASIFLR